MDYFKSEWKKWETGVYGEKELLQQKFASKKAIERGKNFKTSHSIQERVSDAMEESAYKQTTDINTKLMDNIGKLHKAKGMGKQPKIWVNCEAMSVNSDTANHLRSHVRIGKDMIEGADNPQWENKPFDPSDFWDE